MPESYRGTFADFLLPRDLPSVSEVISKVGFKPPFPIFFDFEYEKRFNLLADVYIMLMLFYSKDKFEDIFIFHQEVSEKKKLNLWKTK